MEGITRLVAESLARYGLDRPLDYRRLSWSRWFRCESLHSLLYVPSKPGIFALAEEIMDFKTGANPAATGSAECASILHSSSFSGVASISQAASLQRRDLLPASKSEVPAAERRMLAVLQFCEDDDMAFVLDRMLTCKNPMSARLASGKCFVRFVVIDDETQRRTICNALNQWLISSGEKASGIGAHFASSLEITTADAGKSHVGTAAKPALSDTEARGGAEWGCPAEQSSAAPSLDVGNSTQGPQSLPSGF